MGLGLRGIAWIKTSWFGLAKGNMIDRLHSVARLGESFAKQNGIASVYRDRIADGILHVSFHPAEEDIEFSIIDQAIIVSARTSSVGPGYHAILVDWLDYLSEQAKLIWNFEDDGSGEYLDETGYYEHRDFNRLQESMAEHLEVLSQYVLQSDAANFNLGMPLDFNIESDYFALNSLGYLDRSFFERPDPEHYFAWWQRGVTASTIRNIALCKMWVDFSWHPPKDEVENQELKTIVGLLEQAEIGGAELPDPSYKIELDVLKTVSTLLADDVSRIGFKRQLMRRPTTGGWSLVLPGYYYDGFNEDGTTASFWYDDREVYVTSFTFEPPSSELDWPDDKRRVEHFRFENKIFRAVVYLDDKGLYGRYRSFGTEALVSVIFEDTADLAWAEAVLRSVQLNAPVLDVKASDATTYTVQ